MIVHKTHVSDTHDLNFVMSDETPDRYDDIILANGWDITNFSRNPIALFSHNSSFPIGRWKNMRVEGNALVGRLELAPEKTSDRIDEIRRLVTAGILKSVSVGFRPVESKPRPSSSGTIYTKQELMECSLVSVPANPNAVAIAKSLNISRKTIGTVFKDGGVIEHRNKYSPQQTRAILQRAREILARSGRHTNVRSVSEIDRIVSLLTQVVIKARSLSEPDKRRARDFVHATQAMLTATTYLPQTDQRIFETALRNLAAEQRG